jgi:transcriptional regulator with XRE-family HTH domain
MTGFSAARIRQIRKELNFTREQFARVLWVALKTVDAWESGGRKPAGAHRRLLLLLEHGLTSPSFRTALRDPRADDPLFLLYGLLEPLYQTS